MSKYNDLNHGRRSDAADDPILGACLQCQVDADGYIRTRWSVWAVCHECRVRWRVNYRLPHWTDDNPEPAPFQKGWPTERIWASREKLLEDYAPKPEAVDMAARATP